MSAYPDLQALLVSMDYQINLIMTEACQNFRPEKQLKYKIDTANQYFVLPTNSEDTMKPQKNVVTHG